jgi:hypothetical protein
MSLKPEARTPTIEPPVGYFCGQQTETAAARMSATYGATLYISHTPFNVAAGRKAGMSESAFRGVRINQPMTGSKTPLLHPLAQNEYIQRIITSAGLAAPKIGTGQMTIAKAPRALSTLRELLSAHVPDETQRASFAKLEMFLERLITLTTDITLEQWNAFVAEMALPENLGVVITDIKNTDFRGPHNLAAVFGIDAAAYTALESVDDGRGKIAIHEHVMRWAAYGFNLYGYDASAADVANFASALLFLMNDNAEPSDAVQTCSRDDCIALIASIGDGTVADKYPGCRAAVERFMFICVDGEHDDNLTLATLLCLRRMLRIDGPLQVYLQIDPTFKGKDGLRRAFEKMANENRFSLEAFVDPDAENSRALTCQQPRLVGLA